MISDNNDNFSDILNIVSILLGYQNLIENRQQSADNNISKNNQEQAKQILNDLHAQFDNQNKILEYQNQLLNEILIILKGGK